MIFFQICAVTQIVWILSSFLWYLRRSDEVPLVFSAIAFYSMSYRFWAVTNGLGEWVSLAFSGHEEILPEQAVKALLLVVLGQTLLLGVYMRRQKRTFQVANGRLSSSLSVWLRRWVIIVAIIYFPVSIWAGHYLQNQVDMGKSAAYEVTAWIYELPYVGVGIFIVLLYDLCYSSIRNASNFAVLFLMAVVLYSLYGEYDRFKLIAALTGGFITYAAAFKPFSRLYLSLPVFFILIALFSIGGASRDDNVKNDTQDERAKAGWRRFAAAEDANFLDGFIFEMQETKRYGYRYGGAHLEILYRPIPRFLWKNKPVGSYQLRAMGIEESKSTLTIGISPSLFGTFYEECGVFGVVLFSILYGYWLAYFVGKIASLNPA